LGLGGVDDMVLAFCSKGLRSKNSQTTTYKRGTIKTDLQGIGFRNELERVGSVMAICMKHIEPSDFNMQVD
jgi:hypothetical protein